MIPRYAHYRHCPYLSTNLWQSNFRRGIIWNIIWSSLSAPTSALDTGFYSTTKPSLLDFLLFFSLYFFIEYTIMDQMLLVTVTGCALDNFYRPRSEASEGYVFTGVRHSVTEQGGEGGVDNNTSPPGPGHNTSLPLDNTSLPPPRTRSQHLPFLPPGPGHNTSLPPWTTPPSLPPPGPGHNTSPLDNTSLPPPRIRSQHLPPSQDQVTTPTSLPGPGHNTSLPPPSGQHPPGLCTGGRYASYWNAFS